MATSRIRSFIFLDIEGTGRDAGNEIVEIAFISVHRNAIKDAISEGKTEPRIIDKLVLCVDPGRQIKYLESGLTCHLLQDSGKTSFDKNVGTQIILFLERQAQPACLIAHNGPSFDFLVLSRKLASVGVTIPDVRCGDSLDAFKSLQPFKSRYLCRRPYSLVKLYEEAFGRNQQKSHNAESDAIALMKIVINAGIEMCRWFDEEGIFKLPEYRHKTSPEMNITS